MTDIKSTKAAFGSFLRCNYSIHGKCVNIMKLRRKADKILNIKKKYDIIFTDSAGIAGHLKQSIV